MVHLPLPCNLVIALAIHNASFVTGRQHLVGGAIQACTSRIRAHSACMGSIVTALLTAAVVVALFRLGRRILGD
jgi:hypothetical protein